ncbi:glycosyltransferase [Falsirhodobacter halotolerans]|uniref:glycosyltransferase n=1 Tax=Falsirhodobacter halotolerans TaxID=1146892 RepID=UPI001FD17B36|nr:glycosyltransferase [Falsirhodobacter halotolerans]MCJ8141242.1 glycosyltransferase [Falsirhodobacter halotolerans]
MMRIAVLAHVRHPVKPPFMGGMEAHSWALTQGLMARGHDVTLFAAGDSDPQFRIHPVLEQHYDLRYPWNDYVETKVLHDHLDGGFARACEGLTAGGFDVVHNNTLHRYPPRLARARRMPMVTSLHIPPFDAIHRAVRESAAPWSLFTVTSARQLDGWWPEGPPPAAHVAHNGIDIGLWPFQAKGDGTAVWAGRIARNKGPDRAVEAALRTGIPLTLFGVIEDRALFDATIAPHLGAQIRYGGHLAGSDLAAAIGGASVLMFTPLWDEPFGLVAVEAMSCGLPVAAFDMGAAREVIGEAGRFADPDDAAGFDRALVQAMDIPRTLPRARVEARFTLDRMIDRYEALYAAAIAARDAPAPSVRFPEIELPAHLAPAAPVMSV